MPAKRLSSSDVATSRAQGSMIPRKRYISDSAKDREASRKQLDPHYNLEHNTDQGCPISGSSKYYPADEKKRSGLETVCSAPAPKSSVEARPSPLASDCDTTSKRTFPTENVLISEGNVMSANALTTYLPVS
jgi:hypothetical protein